ncbi:hypothetical protein GUJ93_ZPchr0010g7226 [Zizania palustris]|uniref:Uncharacterized protein n=1 Tax=Zizania palustris TaxID=103762 RepID=A0A8J6BMC5_ZIZPA|nr:hypothetical protein GUJ93_ZPchr0010g7226 [Zizania palustris]
MRCAQQCLGASFASKRQSLAASCVRRCLKPARHRLACGLAKLQWCGSSVASSGLDSSLVLAGGILGISSTEISKYCSNAIRTKLITFALKFCPYALLVQLLARLK